MIEAVIRERIKGHVTGIKSVLDGTALAALNQSTTLIYPSAFVFTAGESGVDDNGLVGSTGQRRVQWIAIVIAVRNVRNPSGGEIRADMEALRNQIDAALFGWQPTEAHEPMFFRRGAMMELKDATLWWQDEYQTAFQRRTA